MQKKPINRFLNKSGQEFEKWSQTTLSEKYYQRQVKNGRAELDELRSKDNDELLILFADLCARYERKKNTVLILVAAIVVSVLTSMWSQFFTFLLEVSEYVKVFDGQETETAEVVGVIILILIVFATLLILMMLFAYLAGMKAVHQRLLIVQEIRKERENSTKEK